MSEASDFHDRLPYEGEPKELLTDIIDAYDLGTVNDFQVVTSGFEDCNFTVETESGSYFVKCYAKSRTQEEIDRSAQVLETIATSDVNHPKLYRAKDNGLLTKTHGVHAVVMDRIDGRSFHDLGRTPTDEEAQLVVNEAAKISKLNIDPPYIYDSIAVVNILDMAERVRPYMTDEDLKLVEPVVENYKGVKVDELPRGFVHGDLISTNVLLDNEGKIWVVDFSVANTYPRLQELAVICSSLLFGKDVPLKETVDKIANMYIQAGGTLTEEEHAALLPLTRAAQAMELMGGYLYIYINKDNAEEAQHWLEVGRKGLLAA